MLTLEARSHLKELAADARFEFDEAGGTIGREMQGDPDRHWRLDHHSVSRLHARITYEHGKFFLESRSTSSGTYVNDAELKVGTPYAISDGDTFRIGPYSVVATLTASPRQAAGAAHPLKRWHDRAAGDTPKPIAVPTVISRAGGDKEVFKLPEPKVRPNPGSASAAAAGAAALPPRKWTPTMPKGKEVLPPSQPVQLSGPPSSPGGPNEFAAMMAGAGLAHVEVTPEVMQTVGEIFRVVVIGLMKLLAARKAVKGELGAGRTEYEEYGNNPLKFSRSFDEALHKLFVLGERGYLPPVAAFDEAFADMRNHQVAMLHAMRAAFDHMAKQFEPQTLETQMGTSRKDNWARYQEWFDATFEDRENAYTTLFGEAFAEAYEAASRQSGRRAVDEP